MSTLLRLARWVLASLLEIDDENYGSWSFRYRPGEQAPNSSADGERCRYESIAELNP